ncbi:ubiquitin-binding ESCRT-I subunit protein MVB12 KNAG_0G00750 [Huiozyma naganishii CBS 8797]|uniref:Multivesicular body sorting factor 12 domain-containing protein n=1 Tax=Huiozyma naganishii (strain ATCC MYA-139 / BCRC 22969 / CBS 8797 / KCTC 17520 / NBRC 10181 / NCYC 3082 / Yp74L-3) TaxID=1071383 RepID=J7S8V7_HUIN7|nr:hypothetical protein KNAG_0G00750 [Kazachstania naganishii CBS 8797]CCK71131.1 hypothetical protein KNAG_0G00750 [Kazachstania naganishii CBS 8797]
MSGEYRSLLRRVPLYNKRGVAGGGPPAPLEVPTLQPPQRHPGGSESLVSPWIHECESLEAQLQGYIGQGALFDQWYASTYLAHKPAGLLSHKVLSPTRPQPSE